VTSFTGYDVVLEVGVENVALVVIDNVINHVFGWQYVMGKTSHSIFDFMLCSLLGPVITQNWRFKRNT